MKHIYSSSTKFLISIIFLQFVITAANAQWSTDPNINNAICTAAGQQLSHGITSDGSGGAIITWQDLRGGSTIAFSDIYAQRISADGNVLWALNGVAVCIATGTQATPLIISDGNGGAIIMWNDGRGGGGFQIYAQRINSAGVTQWTTDGVLIKTSPGIQNNPAITSDGSGGAIITWDTFVANFRYNIYAIRVTSEGTLAWSTTVCNDPLEQQFPQICNDGSGGAIIIWSDARPGINNNDLYAQHLNSGGTALWAENGIVFCAAPKHPGEAHLVSDNLGGAIIVWADYRRRDFYRDIYAQRIDVDGTSMWTTDGVAIYNTGSGDYIAPRIITDGSGGAIIVFESAGSSIIGQRINSLGELQWGAGVGLGAGTWPQLTNSSSGGAISAWHNVSNGKVFAQKLNANGAKEWGTGGIIVSQQGGQRPQLVSDGNGGTIITWADDRNTVDLTQDIFAQNVNTNGTLGNITTGAEEQPELKNNLRLSQNFPNPFDQTTKIKYEIPNGQMVTLKIFNLFGKEIKTLVHEIQPAGTYDVEFNASRITPGIYVYILQAGSIKETKRMILLK